MKQIQKYIQKKMRYFLILVSLVIIIMGGIWYAFLSFKNQSDSHQKDASAAELSINPSSVGGLKMWLDSGSGVTVDGTNKVSQWADRSGNGNNITQATSTKQPILAANATGSRPALQFDGVDDFLSIADNASLRFATQFSLFVVTKNYTTQPNTGAHLSAVSKTDSYSISVANPGPTGNFRLATKQSATVKEFTTNTNTLNDSFSLFSTTYNQPTSTVQMGYNGVLQTVTSSGLNNSLDAGTDFTVGAYSPTVGFLKADISEVLVYNSALSSDSRKQIECYLSAKYGVSAGGACQFNPKSIDNMKLWVDASSQVSANTMQATSDIVTSTVKWTLGPNLVANGQIGTSAVTGEKAWRFTYSGLGSAYIHPRQTTTDGFTEVAPNTSYTFSADLRLNNANGQNVLDGVNGFSIRWYNSSGSSISTESEDKAYTTTWQRFSMTRTSPANAAYAIGIFPSDLANGLSMDYAAPQFEKGSTATAYKPSSFTGGVQLDGFGNVSAWHDLSGSGRNMVQTDKTKRPIFQDSVASTNLNKRPNLVFDGVDDLLSGTQISGSRTIFFVRKVGTANSEIFTDTGSGGQTLVNTSSTNLDISSSNQANVAEIIVYSGTLSSSQQLQVQCYLSVKYNVNVNSACQFEPSHIAGLATWLRADQGVTTDSSGKVVQWQDQSGNGNSAVQNTVTSRPGFLQPGLNGQPSVSLDGIDDFLRIPKNPTLQLTTGATIIAVFNARQNSEVVDRGYEIFGQRSGFLAFSSSLYRSANGGTWRTGGSIYNNANTWTFGGANITNGQLMVSSFSFNNLTGFKVFNNSVQTTTQIASGNNLMYEDSNIGFANVGGTLTYAPIDLSELLVFNQELSTTDRKQVECYLNQKYNLFSTANCITSLSAAVIPGSLSINSPTSLALSTSVSGTTQTATATSTNIIVQDLTGSAAGWSVTATAKNFYQSSTNTVMPLCSSTNCTTQNFSFKPNALQVFSGDLGQGLTSANDNTSTQRPTSLTNLTSTGVSQSFTLGSFSSGFGQGKYQKTITISQNVPPYQRAGSYVGQIIFSVS